MASKSKEIKIAGIKLSRKNKGPLYKQLYDQLRSKIIKGQLRSGDQMPAGRELAKELSISRIIVTTAYEQLILEGYLTGKPGIGTFVADAVPDALLNANTGVPASSPKKSKPAQPVTTKQKGIIAGSRIDAKAFQIGLPSFDAFPYKTWQQTTNSISKKLKSLYLGYEDTLGYWPLRQSIAAYLRVSRGVQCEAEQVIVVTGFQQGLDLVARALLKHGDQVWMEDPGYFGLRSILDARGIKLCPVPIGATGIDLNYAHKKYGPAKMVYVTPSYQFPLGITLSYDSRQQLIEYAVRHGMWILEDDYDSEFRYKGNPLPSLQGMDNAGRVIYCGTFSKVLFPGLRLAYVVVPNAGMVDQFRKIKESFDRQSPILEQAILARFMEEGHFMKHIRKMRLLYAERQQYLIDCLNKYCNNYLTFDTPPAGMHLRCKVTGNVNIKLFKSNISEAGLMVSFIDNFSIEHFFPREFLLGFTAFTRYQLRTAVEQLAHCLVQAI